MTQGGLEALIELGAGDMRRTLNLLQSTCMSAGDVSEESGAVVGEAGCVVSDVGMRCCCCCWALWCCVGWRTGPACFRRPAGFRRPCPRPLCSSTLSFALLAPRSAYATAGKPLPADIEHCAQWLLNEPLREAFGRLLDLQLGKGIALTDILQQLHP